MAGFAAILPRSKRCRRNVAREHCDTLRCWWVIRSRNEENWTMTRSPGPAGFERCPAPVASSRLADAVAASLAIASLSLCLIVTLTVFSIKASMAMPIPA